MLAKVFKLISILLILALVSLGLITATKFLLLDRAMTQLDQDQKTLRQQSTQGLQNSACSQNEFSDVSGPVTYQLRFVTPSQYISEVICFNRPLEGLEFARHQLPPEVERTGGSIGVIARQPSDPMQLTVFASLISPLPAWAQTKLGWLVGRKTITFEDTQVVEQKTNDILPVWTGGNLRSNCQAFGYSCCDVKNQSGQGQILTDTIDCAGQCFPKCLNRPIVLSFGADGSFDPTTRSVEVQNRSDVNFSYVGQAGTASLQTAIISFGDGQKATLTASESTTTYQYNCAQTECKYNANITLIDSQNITSPSSPLTILQVLVRN